MLSMNQIGRKQAGWLGLTMLMVAVWTGFSGASGTDVTVSLTVIGQGSTVPPEGDSLVYVGDTIYFTATAQDGWYFNRWINGAGDDLADPGSADTSLYVESLTDITLTAVFTSYEDSAPVPEILLPFSDVTIAPGESVNFQGTARDGNPPYTYWWDFDGGATDSTEEDPGSQVFNTAGVYQVRLTAYDDDGDSGLDIVTVTVSGGDDPDDDGGGGGGGGCFLNALRFLQE